MTLPWNAPELTGAGRLPIHSVAHADRLPPGEVVRELIVVDPAPTAASPDVARAH